MKDMTWRDLVDALNAIPEADRDLPVVIDSGDEIATVAEVKVVDVAEGAWPSTYRKQDGSLVLGRHILIT